FSHQRGTKAQFLVKTREEAIAKYREWILTQPDLLKRLRELEGKVLGCYCKPKACHGDVLIELLGNRELVHMSLMRLKKKIEDQKRGRDERSATPQTVPAGGVQASTPVVLRSTVQVAKAVESPPAIAPKA